MNFPPFPASLRRLPGPWSISSPDSRRKAVESLPPSSERRSEALDALERVLAAVIDLWDARKDAYSMPGHFDDAWWTYDHNFDQRMPTFDDVSPEAVSDVLAAEVDPQTLFGLPWTGLPDDIAERVGRIWLWSRVGDTADHLLKWLHLALRADAADDQGIGRDRARLLVLVKEALPRLPEWTGFLALLVIETLGGSDEIAYLTELANDPDVPEQTRANAAESLGNLRDRLAKEGGASASPERAS
ncbi:hypothetical protein [Allonocardiopsis opalescens]|uniref:HEAT repeat protein n=1 Tax=Allonocardiopsis opalescens TaxID=1144618 RepID=A0A2T0QFL2_9ACTN|nr:hypothetical protein [Allonocardiopsis opalescens]PRY02726.1 hypothetical protein CLV72_1011329 [Allonocardiopsis opalescens]